MCVRDRAGPGGVERGLGGGVWQAGSAWGRAGWVGAEEPGVVLGPGGQAFGAGPVVLEPVAVPAE